MNRANLFKVVLLAFAFLCSPLSYAKTHHHASQDSKIVAAIHKKFAADKVTSGLKVQVTSQAGIVTLAGKVNTDAEMDQLVQLAESVKGVKDVKAPNLTVAESTHSLSDAMITAKVKGIYLREKLFDGKDVSVMNVGVETTNNVVYLTGVVKNQAQANNAVKYAKSVDGVKEVVSKLTIQPVS